MGSKSKIQVSSSVLGRCSTPLGTTSNSPDDNSTFYLEILRSIFLLQHEKFIFFFMRMPNKSPSTLAIRTCCPLISAILCGLHFSLNSLYLSLRFIFPLIVFMESLNYNYFNLIYKLVPVFNEEEIKYFK